jgi:Ca-activated chloride channel homolog
VSLRFEFPEAFWCAIPLALLLLLSARNQGRTGRFSWLQTLLLATGFLAAIAALSRPQGGQYSTTQRGLSGNVYLAIDVSNSMRVADVSPSRLELAALFLQKVLAEIPGIRVALFPFAADGYLQMPLTTDRDAAADLLASLSPSFTTNQGTDFGATLDSLFRAIMKQRETDSAPTRVLLLSDGETHEKGESAILGKFQNEQIAIDTVGIGTTEGGPIIVEGRGGFGTEPLRDASGKPVHSKLVTDTLKQIAEATGGRFYMGRMEETGKVSQNLLRGMEFGKLKTTFKVQREFFPELFLLSLALLGARFFFGQWHWLIRAAIAVSLLSVTAQRAEAHSTEVENKLQSANRNQRPYVAYNAAVALAKEGIMQEAADLFNESAASTSSPELKKKAYFNLGNTFMELQDPTQALAAYQRAYDVKVPQPKVEAELNNQISNNILLAKQKKTQQESEEKKKGESEDEGAEPNQPQDPGQAKKFQAQQLDENQKKRLYEAVNNEEQRILQRQQSQNKNPKSTPKERQW